MREDPVRYYVMGAPEDRAWRSAPTWPLPQELLWVSSSAPDADFFVYLEEVDGKGASRYVTEGMLRASNRATADPGYDLMGLPYHRGLQSDRADLIPGQPVELVFDLYPTSTLFQPGHRLRVTVTGADKANTRDDPTTAKLAMAVVRCSLTRVRDSLTSVRLALTAVSAALTGVRLVLTGVSELLTGVKLTLTAVSAALTGVKLVLTGVSELLTSVRLVLTGVSSVLTGVKANLTGVRLALTVVSGDLTGVRFLPNGVSRAPTGVRFPESPGRRADR